MANVGPWSAAQPLTGGLTCCDCGGPRAMGTAERCRPCYLARASFRLMARRLFRGIAAVARELLRPQREATRAAKTALRFPMSLDAPVRGPKAKAGMRATLHDFIARHDDWEDRLIERIDRKREIDAWAEATAA